MNPTSRAILQTVVATDSSLNCPEREAIRRLIAGEVDPVSVPSAGQTRLLITQKRAAELMSVNRVTVWRMARDGVLHPVEIVAGTWRYPFSEISRLAQQGTSVAAVYPQNASATTISSAA